MAYVFLVPHERLSRQTAGRNRLLFEHNRMWAEQVASARPDTSVHIIEGDDSGGQPDVWRATLRGYALAARTAGRGGTIGVLVGHGLSGTRVGADLAPPQHCRVFEDQLVGLRPGAARTEIQRRVLAIGSHFVAYRPRVDIYTCSLGTGASASFLDRLAETWRVSVRGPIGRLVTSVQRVDGNRGPCVMSLEHEGRDPRWTDTIPEAQWWRTSQLVERQIRAPELMDLGR